MIGLPKAQELDLAASLAALDFVATNAELDRLSSDHAACNARVGEVREEIDRLGREIAERRGPVSDLVADAIMAGKPLAEAAQAAPTTDALAAQRDALMGSLSSLGERAERLRGLIGEVEAKQRAIVLTALEDYRAELVERQKRAADEIAGCHAGLQAIADVTNKDWLAGLLASRLAMKGMHGPDKLLGHRASLRVPAELVAALKPVADAGQAIRPAPDEVSTTYLY